MTKRLTEAQLVVLGQLRDFGGLVLQRGGRRARSAEALAERGLARVDERDHSGPGLDRWVATGPAIAWRDAER